MTTIKTTVKRKIASITLPTEIRLTPLPEKENIDGKKLDILHLCVPVIYDTAYGCLIDKDVLLHMVTSEIKSVIHTIYDTEIFERKSKDIALKEGITMEVDSELSYANTYNFYKEVKKDIKISSFEQGISVLKDIYHIN